MRNSGHDSASQEEEEEDKPSLPNLLSSLALGARAVHGLPLEDDFNFQNSFPEFASLSQSCRQELLQTLAISLEDPSLVEVSTSDSLDPFLWDKCADACDALVEKVEAYLERSTSATQPIEQWSDKARQQSLHSQRRIVASLVEMEKPQITFDIQVQNDRLEPFVPNISTKHHAVVPLSLEPVEGHGLDSRFGDLRRSVVSPRDIVAPTHHIPHPYREEIASFEYQPWQLEPPATKPPRIHEDKSLHPTWVDTREGLDDLLNKLEGVKEVAVDLEAHSYRSFSGILCLMQMSFRTDKNSRVSTYLVDTLALWHEMEALAPLFANPSIVKVMHGADSDVQWLQRDFGIYIVNLFDTGRASRALRLSSAGLAHLLQKYVNVETDKSFQLADWRQRPLSEEMIKYATMDTHYLLDIYNHLKWDLHSHPDPTVSVEAVLDTSRKVCLIRYDKEPFKPMAYKNLMNNSRSQNNKRRSDLTGKQERVLATLFDWRDQTARDTDESVAYVCSNQGLLRLALSCPTTLTLLQTCLNPMPPLVLHGAQDIVNRIKVAMMAPDNESSSFPPSSAFFKPAKTDDTAEDDELRRATGMSPVLGTEALYKQAGWMTPQHMVATGAASPTSKAQSSSQVVTTSTTDEDDDLDPTTSKPRHLLMVHTANKDYRSTNNYTMHSLGMGLQGQQEHQRTSDGLGSARAAACQLKDDDEENNGATPLLKEESERAKEKAARIRIDMAQEKEELLGVVTGGGPPPSAEEDNDEEEIKEQGVESDDDFEIPKSMKEIYKISNRNRRKNKKSSSPPTARENSSNNNNNSNSHTVVLHAEPKQSDTMEGAEAILATAGLVGKGYFFDRGGATTTDSSSKRQRTKSEEDDVGTKATNEEKSRADDIQFMKEIGWIKNKEEAEELAKEQSSGGDGDTTTEAIKDDNVKERKQAVSPPQAFDYASVGGSMGVFPSNAPSAAAGNNPFFSGAAVAGGGPLTAPAARVTKKKQKDNSNKPSRSGGGVKQERPEKKDGRSFIYKKR